MYITWIAGHSYNISSFPPSFLPCPFPHSSCSLPPSHPHPPLTMSPQRAFSCIVAFAWDIRLESVLTTPPSTSFYDNKYHCPTFMSLVVRAWEWGYKNLHSTISSLWWNGQNQWDEHHSLRVGCLRTSDGLLPKRKRYVHASFKVESTFYL